MVPINFLISISLPCKKRTNQRKSSEIYSEKFNFVSLDVCVAWVCAFVCACLCVCFRVYADLAEQIAVEFLIIDPFIAARRDGLMQVSSCVYLFLQTASESHYRNIWNHDVAVDYRRKTIKYFKLGICPTRTFTSCGFFSSRRVSRGTIFATKTPFTKITLFILAENTRIEESTLKNWILFFFLLLPDLRHLEWFSLRILFPIRNCVFLLCICFELFT